jgi:hypothetical protein
LESIIPPDDQQALQAAESKLSTCRHVRMAVPSVLGTSTDEEAAELRNLAPRLIGVINDRWWSRRFPTHHGPALPRRPEAPSTSRSPRRAVA